MYIHSLPTLTITIRLSTDKKNSLHLNDAILLIYSCDDGSENAQVIFYS